MAKKKDSPQSNEAVLEKELHELLMARLNVAKRYTKDFQDDVKRCIEDYELIDTEQEILDKITNVNRRYEFKIPYIFATHDSMLASMFDRAPNLIFTGRGIDDEEKERKLTAAYEYLIDKVKFETYMNQTAWWFILVGMCSGHGEYKQELAEEPVINEMTGEPEMDEEGNVLMQPTYLYDDPILNVGDPLKEYYSPESQFDVDGEGVPYIFREELLEKETIKEYWGKDIKADASIDMQSGLTDREKEHDDIKRVKTYFYKGQIPAKFKGLLKDYEPGKECYAVLTSTEIVHKQSVDGKNIKLGKWYGAPNKFFGFGIGKTLREFQKELSVRRGQQVRYADVMAHPKIAVDGSTQVDEKALLDPRVGTVIVYKDAPPSYLVPPDLSSTLITTEEKAREDAQFTSGMLDLTSGAQNSRTVKTATGQSLFAEAAERRIRRAKKLYGEFLKSSIVMILKLAQQYWSEDKLISITDENGQSMDMMLSAADLSDIDFDRDIDVDMESVNVNKDVLRAQAIELYDKMKDDPIIERRKIVSKVLRDGFDENNPEQFIRSEEEVMQEQQTPVDEMGLPGQPNATPSGDFGAVPSSPAGIMGNVAG